ncbi:hypothetical protein AXG93_242s1390 [Marchantia polymorpha subsp. ruderalis]|uniref:Retroviral polymerase SH3-like domain-containing protein n=1 Tax=Marchantia polymorpha subsp. ruderalis TaxID=1480154 RepID=A0A176VPR6_MARPO|nr:hypothetical protein AXG93_242s1390 [Marchantia polymorpha subsp. ruderalis]
MLAYLDPTILNEVEEYFEVSKLLDPLQQRFHQKNPTIVMNTYMRLFRFTMKPGTRIQDHIHAYGNLLVDLQNMGVELTNTKKTISYSLPSTYETLSKILLHHQNTAVTYNEVTAYDARDYSRLRNFGCTAYPLIPKEHKTKLDPTSKKCRFLGYVSGVKGYRLWDPVANKVIVSRDVSFNRTGLLKEGEDVEINKGKSLLTYVVVGEFDHSIINDQSYEEAPIHVEQVLEEQELQEQDIVGEPIATIPDKRNQTKMSTRRSQRSSRAPERFGVWANSSTLKDCDLDSEDEDGMALILEEDEPSSFREAQAAINKLEWIVAMEREMESQIDNKT